MKILIADDEKEIVKFLRNFLEKRGHAVDAVYDGAGALDLIKSKNYDLVFVDHNMPELTGLELIKFIKQNKLKAKTIMITGYPEMNKSFAKALGADEYICKPCSLDDIGDIVKKYSVT